MKTAKFFSFLILLSFFLGINSCKKEDSLIENQPICTPTSDYYFSGVVGNDLECWNAYENNYQVYHGGADDHTNSSGFWILGLDKWPVSEDDKTILIYWQVQYITANCTPEQFHQTFQTGSYSFKESIEDINGIDLLYRENGKDYWTHAGDQTGSYFNCNKVTDIGSEYDEINITLSFDCKVYTSDGSLFKEIKQAVMKVSVIR